MTSPPDGSAPHWDARLAHVLGSGDPSGLAGLDPVLGEELMSAAATFPAAGAFARKGDSPPARDVAVTYDGAPYGVGYLVAVWIW